MTKEEDERSSLSTSVGDYLKAIWVIARDGPAGTGDIARALGVTASSVTGMLGKLKRMGLIRYKPYYGAQLTVSGRSEALRLIRRHRLLETFLIRDLGYTWDEVHEEAEAMEHVMSGRFTERLADHLGQPSHDPHGDPIPRDDGSVPSTPSTALCDVDVGKGFTVSRILSQDAEVLGYVTKLGIHPGSRLRVEAREPLGDLLTVSLGGERLSVSRELACLLLGSVQDA
ncbi:MAG: metal-dependent transcriptional regulator [Deinococcales bacterium]